jgi:hypothetical protein
MIGRDHQGTLHHRLLQGDIARVLKDGARHNGMVRLNWGMESVVSGSFAYIEGMEVSWGVG